MEAQHRLVRASSVSSYIQALTRTRTCTAWQYTTLTVEGMAVVCSPRVASLNCEILQKRLIVAVLKCLLYEPKFTTRPLVKIGAHSIHRTLFLTTEGAKSVLLCAGSGGLSPSQINTGAESAKCQLLITRESTLNHPCESPTSLPVCPAA